MQKEAARKLIQDTLEGAFDKEQFKKFTKELLNHLEDAPFTYRGEYIYKDYRDSVKTLERIGKYEDSDGKKIDVLIVSLLKTPSLERARSKQRNFVAKYLKGSRGNELKDGALVAFVSPDERDWRFSFVKMEYKFDTTKKGQPKVTEEFTPARRYSFLVGENEKSHTAQSRLLPILENTDQDPTLAEIEETFSIEKVTKEFFENYRLLFHKIKDALDEFVKKDKATETDFEEKGVDTVDFTKKLLGQIVFLYFLQKKGWFGVGKRSEWGTGPKRFLRELFDKKHGGYENFFNDILEPLFYNTLAVERPGDYSDKFDCRIPFLNGGLFDPLNDYDWQRTDILLSDKLFSNDEKTKQGDVGTGILDVFDRYNFTVKEDEPLEKEVAIDPEMLGKVFENLLEVKDRKSKGTYYTPREIVHYMCQESLINYLATELKEQIQREDIETLIKHGETALENDALVSGRGVEKGRYKYKLPKSVREHNELIDRKLSEIKVCDPAVGSGAFLVGMMSEIVKTRSVLARLKNPDKEPSIYDFKRDAIQDSLHGVDIDLGAVEIAKLRLWLSLIVDEENYKHIKPLPNLDYKIMQGNSLLEEYEGIKLIDERFFERHEEEEHIQKRLKERQSKLSNEYIELHKKDNLTPTKKAELNKRLKEIEKQLKALETPKPNSQGPFDIFGKTEAQSKADKLLDLHERFFNAHHKSEKDRIHKQIDELTWDLIETTLKQKGKEEKLEEVKRFQLTNMSPFFLWKLNFADVFRDKGGFDVVIANPPYGTKLPSDYKSALAKLYPEGKKKQFDHYNFFMVKGARLKSQEGCLTYIIPPTWLTNKNSKKLREFMIEQGLSKVCFIEQAVFEHAVVDSVICELSEYGKSCSIERCILEKPSDMILVHQKEPLSIETLNDDLMISHDDSKTSKLAIKIVTNADTNLGQVADIVFGIQTRKSASDPDYLHTTRINNRCKPALRGKDMGRWYHVKSRLYVEYGKWLWNPRDPKIFEAKEKVIVRQIGRIPMCALDVDQTYTLNTIYNVVPRESCNISAKYLLGILNSTMVGVIWRHLFPEQKDVFPRVKKEQLVDIPIQLGFAEDQETVITIVDKLLALTSASGYDPKKQPIEQRQLEKQLDQMVYKLYGLTAEEIAIVEGANND